MGPTTATFGLRGDLLKGIKQSKRYAEEGSLVQQLHCKSLKKMK